VAWITSLSSILLIQRRFVLPSILKVWELGVCLLSIRLYWESGYGSMLWKEMLFGNRLWIKKYSTLADSRCFEVVGPYGVSLWKHIRRSWDAFSSFVTIKMGNGSQVKF
jgi:hypothetical protein